MSHHIYETKGFVIYNWPAGEADHMSVLFTESLGLILARSRGVRSLSSKMRFGLQDMSISKIALIKGKNQWRVTNAVLEQNLPHEFRTTPDKLALVARLLNFIKRTSAYEQEEKFVFDLFYKSLPFLTNDISSGLYLNFECILMINILRHAGFLAPRSSYERFLHPNLVWSKESVNDFSKIRRMVLRDINESIKTGDL